MTGLPFDRRGVRVAFVAGIVIAIGCAALPVRARAALAIHPTRADDPSSGGNTCSFLPAMNTDCSLRNAVAMAGDGTIVSLAPPAPAGPYTLEQSTPLTIKHSITLAGLGARSSTISQAGVGRVLEIASGVTGVTVQGVTITGGNNTTSGGGILNLGALTLRDSAVTGNFAGAGAVPSFGAGIDSTGTLTVIGSTVSGNESFGDFLSMQPGEGGGISSSGTTTVVNSTISGNTAGQPPVVGTGDGGGIYLAAGTLSLSNVTLASNRATGSAGDLYRFSGAVSAKNTIIGLGAASDAGTENCNGAVVSSFGYNLEDRSQCGLAGTGDQTNADPTLGPLQDNGGQTDTQAPSLDSPAVDHGNPAGCTDAANAVLTVDQRGLTRQQGLACDVGAYELQPLAPAAIASPATGIGQGGATLNGTVDTHGFQTSWQFEYGPTTAYGSSTPAQTLAGGAEPVSAMITGLLPGTTYHFALVASTSGGTTQTADQTFTTSPGLGSAPGAGATQPPVLGPMAIVPSAFRAASSGGTIATIRRTGATVTYTDTQRSTTGLTVLQARPGVTVHGRCAPPPKHTLRKRGRACTRYVSVGGFTHTDASGSNRFRFTGRLGGHKLPPGNYELKATPRANGTAGKTVSARFRILR